MSKYILLKYSDEYIDGKKSTDDITLRGKGNT